MYENIEFFESVYTYGFDFVKPLCDPNNKDLMLNQSYDYIVKSILHQLDDKNDGLTIASIIVFKIEYTIALDMLINSHEVEFE